MAKADIVVADIAGRQHGVVTSAQLLAAGVSRSTITRRVRAHEWLPVAPGTYQLRSHTFSLRSRVMTATLATPGSVASHTSAARLHGFEPLPKRLLDRYHVTVEGEVRRDNQWWKTHRVRHLDAVDTAVVEGIPCTSPARTLIDLAMVLAKSRMLEIFDRQLAGGIELADVADSLTRITTPGRPGTALVREIVGERIGGGAIATSELERRFLRLVDAHRLPQPETQWLPQWADDTGIGRVDFAYPEAQLLIEVDGRRWHTLASSFETDRHRDQHAVAAGWQVLRFSWSDVVNRPHRVARLIVACLDRTNAA